MSEGFSNELRAGAARVDISPGLGTQVAGGIGLYRPTQLIIDPIYAKALVLQAGSRKLCFLSLDLPVASTEVATAARHRAGEQFGYDPAAIMIHCTQNHAAPMWGHVAVSPRRLTHINVTRIIKALSIGRAARRIAARENNRATHILHRATRFPNLGIEPDAVPHRDHD